MGKYGKLVYIVFMYGNSIVKYINQYRVIQCWCGKVLVFIDKLLDVFVFLGKVDVEVELKNRIFGENFFKE